MEFMAGFCPGCGHPIFVDAKGRRAFGKCSECEKPIYVAWLESYGKWEVYGIYTDREGDDYLMPS